MQRGGHAHGNFNPRSREGSDGNSDPGPCHPADFNPRSREGSDTDEVSDPDAVSISIRAPARGATVKRILLILHQAISIRAPARGATAEQCALIISS